MRKLSGVYSEKYDLTSVGWRLLGAIGRYGPVNPSALAKLTSTDDYNVTRGVNRLVSMELIKRSGDSKDGRRVHVELTRRGTTVFRDIDVHARAMESQLRSALSDNEWAAFSSALDKIEARARALFTR